MKISRATNGRTMAYTYDSVGNILRVNSSYPMPQYQVTERYTYDSADQLLTAESTCNNNVLCSGAYSYNNWGKINTYTQQTTDPATNTSENKDYRYYFPGSSADMEQGQTSFAPIIKYDMQQNTQPLETCTYGINGSIRKRLDHQTQNTDYYYFNASGNLKACGTDMQISLYGYNASNTRTYKVNMFNANQWVNGQPQPIQPMVQSAMFYPNTYINFNQGGDYTKHYYNGTERICSRLGEQQIPISVDNNQELEAYQHNVKEVLRNAIGQHLYDEPTDMQEGDVIPLEFLQVTGDNNAIFYYHPNHLASTMYVTDVQQSVVQSFLYAPYGEIISEYNTHVMGEAFPKYSFNAKELDEETGMYYYEARYYAPPVFTSRDPMFEKKPWLGPYHYCSNNPVGRIDPSGCDDDWYENAMGHIIWTDCKSQKEMDEKGIFGEYLGQAYIEFTGTRWEKGGPKNGKGNYIDGDGACNANVTVYGPKNADDIHYFTGYTMTSNAEKYIPINEGLYKGVLENKGGALPSIWKLNGNIRTLDGVPNTNPECKNDWNYKTQWKTGIFIHSTGTDGNLGTRNSTGCLLILDSEWSEFNNVLANVNTFSVRVQRYTYGYIPLEGVNGPIPNIFVPGTFLKK